MILQGVYQHYKGGYYTVLMQARCSDNGPNEGDSVVIYVSHTTGSVCTRLSEDFFGKVGEVERFKLISHSISL